LLTSVYFLNGVGGNIFTVLWKGCNAVQWPAKRRVHNTIKSIKKCAREIFMKNLLLSEADLHGRGGGDLETL